MIEKDCVIKEVDIPVIQSSKNNGIGGSCARKPSQSPDKETQTLPRDQKQLVDDDPSTQKIMVNKMVRFTDFNRRKCNLEVEPSGIQKISPCLLLLSIRDM